METIGECVGGGCDGVQIECADPSEPDDWPDGFQGLAPGGATDWYEQRVGPDGVQIGPQIVNGRRVAWYDVAR